MTPASYVREEKRAGKEFGSNLVNRVSMTIVEAMKTDRALFADLMLRFDYYRLKAEMIEEAAAERPGWAEGKGRVWRDAAKRAYREGIEFLMREQLAAWKKQAPVGKAVFNRAASMMPMAACWIVFPNDPAAPAPPTFEADLREFLHSVADFAGYSVQAAA